MKYSAMAFTHAEDANHNQYWYSDASMRTLADCATTSSGRVAFLSTPSVFFTVPESIRQQREYVLLDYDATLGGPDSGVVPYDFNKPELIPAALRGAFQLVVIDPPFITAEVWRAYGVAANLLLYGERGSGDGTNGSSNPHPAVAAGGSKDIVATTVLENESLLREIFGPKLTRSPWRPSIPNLVYQYELFTTLSDFPAFQLGNSEIPE